MKINLTKKHISDLEKAVKILKDSAKQVSGSDKKSIVDVGISISDILVRHDNRMEKDY